MIPLFLESPLHFSDFSTHPFPEIFGRSIPPRGRQGGENSNYDGGKLIKWQLFFDSLHHIGILGEEGMLGNCFDMALYTDSYDHLKLIDYFTVVIRSTIGVDISTFGNWGLQLPGQV